MFAYLLILFIVIPALELALLIEVGGNIGAWNTISLIIFTGVLGAALARYQGFMVLQKIQASVNKGLMPNEELMDGLMILVGGIVLLTPGFITDVLGFFLLVPLTRTLIKKGVRHYFDRMMRQGQHIHMTSFRNGRSSQGYDDIDIN